MSRQKLKSLIVILGPTASGKSSLAIKLAKKFKGEIISADSRQIYRGMNVGTGKVKFQNSKVFVYRQAGKTQNSKLKSQIPNFESQIPKAGSYILVEGVPHYMIDVVNPDEEYSVGEYKEAAIKIIQDIQARGKVPFLVGGTGLYIQAVVDNLDIPKVESDIKFRKKIEKEIREKGLEKVWEKLIKLDPGARVVVQKENPRRVVRALEVCFKTGKPFTSQKTKGEPLFGFLQIGLKVEREKLYKKIDKRIDEMIEEGLIEEVRGLAHKYSWKLSAMSGIGYKEIGEYLRGEKTLEEAIERVKFNTHKYVRSQSSWFRRDKRIIWLAVTPRAIISVCQKFLENRGG